MLTIDALPGRVRRLNDLYRGLAKETHVPKPEENDPLLFLERHAYRMAMHNAVEALEEARVALATAIQRIEEEKDAATRRGGYVAPAPPRPPIADRSPSPLL